MLSFPISATLLSESDMAQECEEVTRFFMLKLNEYRARIIEEDGEVF